MENLEQSSGLASSPAEQMPPTTEYLLGILKFCICAPEANCLFAALKSGPCLAGKYVCKLCEPKRCQGADHQQPSPGVNWIKPLEQIGAWFDSRWQRCAACYSHKSRLLGFRSGPEIAMK